MSCLTKSPHFRFVVGGRNAIVPDVSMIRDLAENRPPSSGSRRMRKADADAVDAAVGAGEDLKAKAVFYDDFAGERNVAGDLRDQPTKRSRFIVFRKRERRGVFSCV